MGRIAPAPPAFVRNLGDVPGLNTFDPKDRDAPDDSEPPEARLGVQTALSSSPDWRGRDGWSRYIRLARGFQLPKRLGAAHLSSLSCSPSCPGTLAIGGSAKTVRLRLRRHAPSDFPPSFSRGREMRHPAAGGPGAGGRPLSGSGGPAAGPSRPRASQRLWSRASYISAGSILLAVVVCWASLLLPGLDRRKPRGRFLEEREPLGVIPGEFERQEAILIAWPEQVGPSSPQNMDNSHGGEDRVFREIVQAVWRSVQVIILAKHSRSQDRVARLLSQAGIPDDAVRFVQIPFQCEWIRDYGPLAVRAGDGSYTWIDADYVDLHLVSVDPYEDRLPSALGALLRVRTVRAPFAMEHGNLLGNGRGLCITTQRLLDDNTAGGYDADDVTRMLKQVYGAKEVVFLERMQGEHTGHVDMFATFPSPDTIVIGRCSPESDPANAAILDRNAERLESLGSPCGPLKVVRVPMLPRIQGRDGLTVYPTYTNVLYANDTLLVPIYPALDPASDHSALTLYQKLLPDWTIVGIDIFPILELAGGIHCVTLNLPTIGNGRDDSAAERPQSQSSED